MKISSTLVIACAWGRYFLARNFESFAPILIPSFMMAILYPFFLNSMGKFVCVWFGDGQVSGITIPNLINYLPIISYFV